MATILFSTNVVISSQNVSAQVFLNGSKILQNGIGLALLDYDIFINALILTIANICGLILGIIMQIKENFIATNSVYFAVIF